MLDSEFPLLHVVQDDLTDKCLSLAFDDILFTIHDAPFPFSRYGGDCCSRSPLLSGTDLSCVSILTTSSLNTTDNPCSREYDDLVTRDEAELLVRELVSRGYFEEAELVARATGHRNTPPPTPPPTPPHPHPPHPVPPPRPLPPSPPPTPPPANRRRPRSLDHEGLYARATGHRDTPPPTPPPTPPHPHPPYPVPPPRPLPPSPSANRRRPRAHHDSSPPPAPIRRPRAYDYGYGDLVARDDFQWWE